MVLCDGATLDPLVFDPDSVTEGSVRLALLEPPAEAGMYRAAVNAVVVRLEASAELLATIAVDETVFLLHRPLL